MSIDTKVNVLSLQASTHFDTVTKWLSAPDSSTNLNKARELHQPGTGQWLLDSGKYQSWKANRGSFLWLHGIPGCGKTILSSTVIGDLEKDPLVSGKLLFFYFDFTDINKRSTENAVRSFIDQLYRKNAGARRLVDSLYASYAQSGGQPPHSSLQVALQGIINNLDEAWIVLDGLDECETRGQHVASGIIPWIKNLKDTSPNIHLLVTSWPEQDIKATIDAWADAKEVIPLQSDLVRHDIEMYILAKVEQMERWRTRPDVQKSIVTALHRRAGGM